jgi:2-keto-4-pentenoate hydratase/2-oxohepta-3-ene-1,7-dioic acid hydratase in catechol pathway
MKIIAVAQNYEAHNKEMNSPLIEQERPPVLFIKPESALLKEGKPFFYPDFSNNIHYETEIVVKIDRLGKNISKRFAHRYYSELTVGIDFTARDLQGELKKIGMPWEIAKGFDYSAAIGDFVKKEELFEGKNSIDFGLNINSQMVQQGNTSEMIHSIDEIIEYASRFFTLKIGDLLFTGTPAGVGPVKIDDHLEGFVNGRKLLDFYVK